MELVILSPLAKRDIIQALKYTKERWGYHQAREYGNLITEALLAIARDPQRGRPRGGVRPGILAYPISQPSRPARHVLFYRIARSGTVEIVRFLHDAMDVEQHLP